MTSAATFGQTERYAQRATRAAHLAGERPHAAELLTFYGRILDVQEPLFKQVLGGEWLGRASVPPIESLPFTALDRPFVAYVERVTLEATEALAGAGTAIVEAPSGARAELLRRTATMGDLDPVAAGLDCEVPRLVFYSRGFLQPLTEALVAREAGSPRTDATLPDAACPHCGWPPQVAVLRDDGGSQGKRTLVCGLCATEWPFPRVRCPSCGETDAHKLVLHEAESVPALRVEECQGCQAYLKAIDLRRDGTAVPVVEDLASPELDVWAEERGLWKICRNLMGL